MPMTKTNEVVAAPGRQDRVQHSPRQLHAYLVLDDGEEKAGHARAGEFASRHATRLAVLGC